MTDDSKRGTGRTTRMLQHAIKLNNEGHSVYIITANHSHGLLVCKMLAELIVRDGISATIKLTTLEVNGIKIEVSYDDLGNFDWQTMSLRGANKNCVVLVDHFAIESRFSLMLKMLEAYDQ